MIHCIHFSSFNNYFYRTSVTNQGHKISTLHGKKVLFKSSLRNIYYQIKHSSNENATTKMHTKFKGKMHTNICLQIEALIHFVFPTYYIFI